MRLATSVVKPVAVADVCYNAGMDGTQINAGPLGKARCRWFRLSPDRFVISLLFVIGLLWLSDRFQWFGVNQHKGWTVLIAVAAVALVMLLWWIASLTFHWRFQFGIRSLLAFCLASSIAAGWLAVEMKRARRQAETVEGIWTSGAWAKYDWEFDADGSFTRNPQLPGPSWLRNLLGVDFFSVVAGVNFSEMTITDAGFEQLKDLTGLRTVSLGFTNVTDAGLEQLKGLRQVRELVLSSTKVTDDGLTRIGGITQLQTLYLYDTKVADAGLEHLKGLTELHLLDLTHTKITDAGLEHLGGLTHLQELRLDGTKVTDTGVKKLQQSLPNCKIYR